MIFNRSGNLLPQVIDFGIKQVLMVQINNFNISQMILFYLMLIFSVGGCSNSEKVNCDLEELNGCWWFVKNDK